jgi:hypothetical protein
LVIIGMLPRPGIGRRSVVSCCCSAARSASVIQPFLEVLDRSFSSPSEIAIRLDGIPKLRERALQPPDRIGIIGAATQCAALRRNERNERLAARFRGVRTVEIEGRRVTFATDAEMAGRHH